MPSRAARRLLGVGARADAEEHIRRGQPELLEEATDISPS